ncbi:MAG: ATP-binding protein [Gammaproteobacteria bacterium]|jgi:signal transduction histidine kinase
MKLAPRLLLVASVTLLLPWAGCEYIREVESAMRDRQAETLGASADMLAAVLGSRLDAGLPGPGGRPGVAADTYAHPLERAPRLDGYADDWGLPSAALRTLPGPAGPEFTARYQLATDGISLFLFLQVDDDQVITGDSGDQVRLRMGSPVDGFTELEFVPEAPGPIRPRTSRDGIGRRVRGNWQATSGGYNLEAQIPLQLAGQRLGLLVSDADGRGPIQRTGTMENLAHEPGRLITPLRSADSILEGSVRPGQRLRLVDRDGYVLAEADGGAAPSGQRLPPPARRLFRWIIRDAPASPAPPDVMPGRVDSRRIAAAVDGAPSDTRIGDIRGNRMVFEAIRPVILPMAPDLVLIAEEDSERILSLTDRAASKLFVSSFAISLSAAALLLGFAAWLSWRIRRLSRAAREALATENPRLQGLPEDRSRDELGELSRNFSRLLGQIGEYNDYLQNLGSRLTHELRTPMTVVRTSLENLQAEPGDPRYLRRARQGMDRLQAMVVALGAATRMEQIMASAETERFDLAGLLRELGAALQTAHPDRDLQLRLMAGPCRMTGAPDLVAQMVDKLVENALDFCPPDGRIWVGLAADGDDWLLEVGNTGSRLPPGAAGRLFDSMTSVRDDDPGRPHLGLGLYIVRLVARHHQGSVHGENLEEGDGVRFVVRLPAARPGSAD